MVSGRGLFYCVASMTDESSIGLPPLAWLRAFGAMGRLGSFEQAARELHVTPATVSRQVRALETLLETRLFERSGGAVALSEEGQGYHRVVEESLRLLQDGTRALAARRGALPPRK